MKSKKHLALLVIFLFFLFISMIVYFALLKDGRKTYEYEANRVQEMIRTNPTFFTTVFTEIFPAALSCPAEKNECVSQTRTKLDKISISSKNYPVDFEPSNRHPMYFIQVLPDGKIAKLFFSGDVKIETADTREERKVVALLKAERSTLYGPYYDQELILLVGGGRAFFDPKPAYLKDLYAQVEVIVPYAPNSDIIGGVVYLHGE